MDSAPSPRPRHDGWTAERRRRFLEALAAGWDVGRACAFAGLSREAAYKLRRRETAFAQQWDAALQAARNAEREAFLAMLPEKLVRTMSDLSGECKLRGAGMAAQDRVRVVRPM